MVTNAIASPAPSSSGKGEHRLQSQEIVSAKPEPFARRPSASRTRLSFTAFPLERTRGISRRLPAPRGEVAIVRQRFASCPFRCSTRGV